MDNICDYDEAYTRDDAEEIGWCSKCKIENCPKNFVYININLRRWVECPKCNGIHETYCEHPICFRCSHETI